VNITRVFDRLRERDGRLDLSELDLTDHDLSDLAAVADVRDLSLGENPLITVPGLKMLAPLGATLEAICLWDLPLDDEWLQVMPTLFPRLKQLSFGGENVIATLDGLQSLNDLSCLESVITDNRYTEELLRLYPRLKVEG